MDVMNRIKQLQEQRGWTEYRLAKESGLSQSTLNNIFSRNTIPTIATIEIIAKCFGITLSQFFAEGGEPVELTGEQRLMLGKWNALSSDQKQALLNLIENMK